LWDPSPQREAFRVLNATGVVIDDVVVDGRGLGSSVGYNGIYFGDAGGTVQNSTVTGVRGPLQPDGTPSGAQIGRAIHADNNDGSPRTIEVLNNTITDFQKTGVDLRGDGLTVDVSGNTITGSGFLTSGIAQNGVSLVFGPTGTVSNNTITELGNDFFSTGSATGILLFDSGDGVEVTGNTISGPVDEFGATIPNTTNGIASASGEADNLVITGNTISDVLDGIRVTNNSDNPTISGNTITDLVPSITTTDSTPSVQTGESLVLTASSNDAPLLFAATDGTDILTGTDFDDALDGGTGDDVLTGGSGADLFIMSGASFDNDRITDFEDGVDLIVFRPSTGVTSFDDIIDIRQTPDGDVVIETTAGNVRLEDVDLNLVDITEADFFFG